MIGVDRREDFSNEEIFQRLLGDEIIHPVFLHPKNESERNINAKYISARWIQESLLNGIINPDDFINSIRLRVFSLQLINYIKDNIRKVNFFTEIVTEE